MSDLPAKGAADMDKWKLRIEAAALGISASELLIKLIELAVTHFHEFGASADGSMDDQTQATQKIEEDLNVEYSFPDPPKRYTPGPPVDWKSLSQLLTKAKQAINPSAEVDAQLESAFDQWVHGLRNSHKEELICAIAEYSDASGQIKLGDIRAETGDATRPFFVGDRIAVCRWYLGVTNLPDIVSKPVRRVAFLKGSDEAFKADEKLNRLYPDRTVTLQGRADIVNKLFKTSDFDLIHFTGHCREQQAKALGGLELADGTFLRLIEIGQLEAERTFAAAQPFVMLNACASAQPYLGLTQRGSFAHRFVISRACAVVGTLWPVAGTVANEFAERFYIELASKSIGQALLAAKLALMRDDTGIRDETDEISRLRRLAREVAVRSYCLFANPDLRLTA